MSSVKSMLNAYRGHDGSRELVKKMKSGQKVSAEELAAVDSDIKVKNGKVDLAETVSSMRAQGEADHFVRKSSLVAGPIAGASVGALLGGVPGAAVGFVVGAAGGLVKAAGLDRREADDREAFRLYAMLQGPEGFTNAPQGVELETFTKSASELSHSFDPLEYGPKK